MKEAPGTIGVSRQLSSLLVFAVAFGVAEAVCARYLYSMLEHWGIPDPLILEDSQRDASGIPSWFVRIESLREFTTFLMIGAVVALCARSRREAVSVLLIVLGGWDLTYYLAKIALFQGPGILLERDCIIVFPVSVWLPTYIPMVCSAVFLSLGVAGFRRSASALANTTLGRHYG